MKKLRFEVHLSSRALPMYELLKDEHRQDYEKARDELTKLLQPVKLDSCSRSRINSRRQPEGKTVDDFDEAFRR